MTDVERLRELQEQWNSACYDFGCVSQIDISDIIERLERLEKAAAVGRAYVSRSLEFQLSYIGSDAEYFARIKQEAIEGIAAEIGVPHDFVLAALDLTA